MSSLRSVVVVGGSIAAVTAAESLRAEGFDGEITMVAQEAHLPYSRVPLSKAVLGGREPVHAVTLPPVSADVVVRTGTRAIRVLTDSRRVVLADGEQVPYDGLVIATGGSARRIGRPEQTGELVLRTLEDADRLIAAASGARDAIVVGGGVLGMEIASSLLDLGLGVTVVEREPPLERLLGPWLAQLVVAQSVARGLRVVVDGAGTTLLGTDPIEGVQLSSGRLSADVVVTACGDVPATAWLASSGLAPGGVLVIDDCARVAPGIVAAGDVAFRRAPDGTLRRAPFWANAIQQGGRAAHALLAPTDQTPLHSDDWFWTEHRGLSLKVSGPLPVRGEPEVLAGSGALVAGLFRWPGDGAGPTAAAINHRMPAVALKRLGAKAAAGSTVSDA